MQVSPGDTGDGNPSLEGSRDTLDLTGYAQPDTTDLAGADAAGLVVRRRRTGLWLGIGGAVVAAAVAVVLVLIFAVNGGSSQAWTLTAPTQADGFPQINTAGATGSLDNMASELQSAANRSSDNGHINSTVVAVYGMNGSQGGADNPVAFIGLNGSFSSTAISSMQTGLGAKMVSVKAGPHGGTANCGTAASGNRACYWASSTTVGILEFNPTETANPNVLDALMIKMRNDVEKPVG
jgi:hypothetical protein